MTSHLDLINAAINVSHNVIVCRYAVIIRNSVIKSTDGMLGFLLSIKEVYHEAIYYIQKRSKDAQLCFFE